jgi:hypothetical protein
MKLLWIYSLCWLEKEEDHDVDHYERGEKFIAVKVETPPQVEIDQQFVVKKNQQSHWDLTYEA